MGLPHISAITYQLKKSNFERFTAIGLQKTQCYDDLITDSAAGGTAMATGRKTFRNAIGVDHDTVPVHSILYYAEKNRLKTGVVTNSSIVHATPASFYAHQPFRALTEFIAADLNESNIDFLIGGGKKFFDERRSDGTSLIPSLLQNGYDLFDHESFELYNLPIGSKKKILYFSSDGEPSLPKIGQDYLSIASKKALSYLNKNNLTGFFLVIEGAQIDWAGHGRDEEAMMVRMNYFDQLLKELIRFVKEDGETLLVVTADHSTGELGFSPNSRVDNFEAIFNHNDHTASMVPVFAMGPGAELFKGIYENTELFFKMMKIMKWEEEL